MSGDLNYFKGTLNPNTPLLNQALTQRADGIAAGLANKGISEEEKQELKKQKSELMGTIRYKGIDFSDDQDGFFVKNYKSDYLETDDIGQAEAIAFAAQMGIVDTVRGVQQFTGIGAEEVDKQQQRLRRLMANEEYGGKVMAAYMGGVMADPVGWLLPFAKVYKAATLPAKMAKMAAAGMVTGGVAGATGYVDEQMQSLVGEGQMTRAEQFGIGVVSGGVLAPTIGAGVNAVKYLRGKEYLPLREVSTPEPVSTRIVGEDLKPTKATKPEEATEAAIREAAPKKPSIVEPSLDSKSVKIKTSIVNGKPKIEKDVKPTMASKVGEFNSDIVEGSLYGFARNNPTSAAGTVGGFVGGWHTADENANAMEKTFNAFLGAAIGGLTGKIVPRIPVTKSFGEKFQSVGFTKPKDIGNVFGELFVDRYSLRRYPEFKNFLDDLSVDQNLYLGKVKDLTTKLDKLTDAERKTLYKILVGEADDIKTLTALRVEARELIKEFGSLAVEKGLIKRETFLQNLNTYIHRTYMNNIDNATVGMNAKQRSVFIKKMNKQFANVKVIGDQIKPRGLTKVTTLEKYVDTYSKQTPGSHLNKISKTSGLDKVAKANNVDITVRPEDLNHKGWEFLDDIVKTKKGYFKVLKRADPVVDKDGNFVNLGKILKKTKLNPTDAVNIRWQLTKAQREALGEIEDASFALRETGSILIKDTTTIDFFNKTARTYGKTQKQLIDEGLDIRQIDELYELVPETPILSKIGKIDPDEVTSLKSYGELAGKYIPKEIAREIADIDNISSFLRASFTGKKNIAMGNLWGKFYASYRSVNTFWKKSKTAYNPAVHVNNVVSNVLLYDFAGASYRHLHHARKAMFAGRKNGLYRLAQDTGLFDKSFLDVELKEVQKLWKNAYQEGYIKSTDDLAELLDGSMKNAKVLQKELKRLSSIKRKVGDAAWYPFKKLEDLYKHEDYFFRLGVFRDRIQKGLDGTLDIQKKYNRLALTDADKVVVNKILNGDVVDLTKPGMENVKALVQYSKNQGVKWFIDYDIQAPGINILRATATPFLAYSYRVVPLLAEATLTRPQKLMKWVGIGYGLDMLGSNVSYDLETGDFKTSKAVKEGDVWDMMFNPGTEAEKLLMKEQDRGNLFGFPGFPSRMLKVPITIDGTPQYLDVTRWTPGGDVFDVRQGNGRMPFLPSPLQPSFGAIGSLGTALSGWDPFRAKPIPGYGLDAWADTKIVTQRLLLDFMPNIVLLGYNGVGSYSYLKVRQALARQGKEGLFKEREAVEANVFQDDLTVLQAIGHTFGIKLIPVEYEKLEVRKRAEMAGDIEKILDKVRDDAKKFQKGIYTEEQYEKLRLEAIEERDKIFEKYDKIFEKSSALWSEYNDPMKSPIWPYETEVEKQNRQSMMMDAIEEDKTLYYKDEESSAAPHKIIKKYASKYNVDPKIIEGIVVAESKFDPNTIGDKELANRAYGLMQVRKPALDDVNKFYNLNYTEKDLMDPEINLEVGIAYFAMQRDKYGIFDADKMIQAYNAGPGNESPVYLSKVKEDIGRVLV